MASTLKNNQTQYTLRHEAEHILRKNIESGPIFAQKPLSEEIRMNDRLPFQVNSHASDLIFPSRILLPVNFHFQKGGFNSILPTKPDQTSWQPKALSSASTTGESYRFGLKDINSESQKLEN